MHTLSIRSGVAQRLHRIRTTRAGKWIRSRGFAALIEGQCAEAMPQDPADLRFLYEEVMRHRPQRLIEFGSGQSTVFIAQALYDRGAGHLWSLDADSRWIEHTRSLLPHHLRSFVTLVHSPLAVNTEYGMPTWEYTVIPEGQWDFVMLDGPPLIDGIHASCDLIKLTPWLSPGARGFIDHRWRTATLARELAGDRLRLRYRPSLESFTIRSR